MQFGPSQCACRDTGASHRSESPDALVLAARKRRSGCSSCADAYLTLARQSGATDADITAVLNQG
jgi:hypothetical protein